MAKAQLLLQPDIAPQASPAPSRNRASHCPAKQTCFLSVVIVNYCQWRNTARLTNQLRRSNSFRAGEAEIVIVDNHSPPHPLLTKLRRIDGVSVRLCNQNRGFARAVNEGIRLGEGKWILLLNPDMSVPDGFLDEVELLSRRLLDDKPHAGVIGLGVWNTDGTPQSSCGPLPTFLRTITGLFRARAKRKCRPVPGAEQTQVPWATGCALLIRRECLEDIGGFDPDFFLYYEDVDFCQRAQERDWKVYFEPSLRVIHHHPLHGREVSPPLRLMTRHALLTYGVKHWSRWQALLLGAIVWMESSLRQMSCWWRGRTTDSTVHAQIRKLVGDVLGNRDRQARSRIRFAAAQLRLATCSSRETTC